MQGQVFPVENVYKVKEAGDAYFQKVGIEDDKRLHSQVDAVQQRIEEVLTKGPWVKKHIEVIPICVPLKAKIESFDDLNGVMVKEAYYTARYDEKSGEEYFGPMNHTDTYVINGKDFGSKKDILLRTGNPILRLKPDTFQIVQQIAQNKVIIFFVEELKKKKKKQVLDKTGVERKYQDNESIFGGVVLHTKKRILWPFWKMLFRHPNSPK